MFRQGDVPQDSWDNDKCGDYVAARASKHAEDVWLIGRAMMIAHHRCSHGQWGKWLKAHAPWITRQTARKYIRVAEHVKLDEIRGMTITAIYKALRLVSKNEPDKPKEEPEPGAPPRARENRDSKKGYVDPSKPSNLKQTPTVLEDDEIEEATPATKVQTIIDWSEEVGKRIDDLLAKVQSLSVPKNVQKQLATVRKQLGDKLAALEKRLAKVVKAAA